jgi:hypothetical protein
MGVPASTFVDTYNEKVTTLMVKLVEYVQAMDNILITPGSNQSGGPDHGPNGIPVNMIQQSSILEKNENGFPILPDPIPSEGWKKTTWDSLFTDYLGQQYHLACGGIKRKVPYKRISEKQNNFIENKYLPRKTIFRSPRNITIEEMKHIFDHLLQRQRTYGPEDTFKFNSIKFKGKTVPSNYEIDVNGQEPTPEHIPGTSVNISTTHGPVALTNADPAGFTNAEPADLTNAEPAGLSNAESVGPIEALPIIPSDLPNLRPQSSYVIPSPIPIPIGDSSTTLDPVSGGEQVQKVRNTKILRPRPRPIPKKKNKN